MKQTKFGVVLPIILLSYFMILLDNSIIFTSTAKIAIDLNLTTQALAWITNAYALTFGGLLLFAGKLGDVWGRKKLFSVGLLIFSISSLLVGLSMNGPMIIGMRAVQGIGAAILAPTTLALLMDNYQGSMRTRAIAYYGATGGLGASFGLVVGGLIASYASWRDGFFLNFPLGILMLGLTVKFIRNEAPVANKLDLAGTILSVVGLSGLVYSIDGSVGRLIALVVAIISLVSLVWHENRAESPILPLVLFKNGERTFAYLSRFVYVGFSLAYFFLTPLALQHAFGFTPLMAAIGFLPETLPQFITATLLSRLTDRYRNSRILLLGMLLSLIGISLTSIIGLQRGYWLAIAFPMVIIGIGQGLVLSPLTVAGVARTNASMSGAASSVVNTIHQIGGSVGLSIVVALTAGISEPIPSYNMTSQLMVIMVLVAMIFSVGVAKFSSNN
ncbi:MFS transporter [Lactiplantibacillus carotarum]|uniref:MFS transporter n=1 Tax=Lactiplantibacillus carotarum TaxID=2993456 RepID=UPI00298F042F|nr:MFS transporter [Lactiplantibacillus carotarum]